MKLGNILLGLIQMKPRISGYEMKTIIRDSTGFFFTAHLSQIYPALKDLTQRGWVTHETIQQDGKPNLKVYTITEAGSEALAEWLTSPYEFDRTRSSFDMYFTKLIFMGSLEPEQIVAYIDSGIKAFSSEFADYYKRGLRVEQAFIEDAPEPDRSHYLAIWSDEMFFIEDDLARRIDWLRALREKLLET